MILPFKAFGVNGILLQNCTKLNCFKESVSFFNVNREKNKVSIMISNCVAVIYLLANYVNRPMLLNIFPMIFII